MPAILLTTCQPARRTGFAVFALLIMTPQFCAAQPTIEQVNQAFDIADKAAANGLIDLSMRAVSRALSSGPPVVSTATDQPTLQHFGARIDTSRPVPPTEKEAIDRRIRYSIFRLSDQWSKTAAPVKVYEAIREIVFPPDRPSEAFLYGFPLEVDPLQPDRLPPVKNAAILLIDWAKKSDRLSELQEFIAQRDLANSVAGNLVGLLCSLELQNPEDIDRYNVAISRQMVRGADRESAEITASVGIAYYQNGQHLAVAANLLELAGLTIRRIDTVKVQNNSPCSAILLAAARCWFSTGETERGARMLEQYLNSSPHKNNATHILNRQTDVVGSELFSRGLVAEARDILGEDIAKVFERRYQMTNSVEVPKPSRADSTGRIAKIVPVSPQNAGDAMKEMADQIWVCQLDTVAESSTVLFTLPDFQHADSLVVSPDGTLVAFDATFPNEAITSDGQIYVAKLDGSRIDCLGKGCSPSWSPAGKRMAYSAFLPTRGVWIMRSSGEDARLVDPVGWSGRWSPDGRMVAYSKLVNGRWDIVVYDIVENEYFSAFGKAGCPFAEIFPDFTWSTDSSMLLFKASVSRDHDNTGFRLIALSVLSNDLNTLVDMRYGLGNQISWSSTGSIAFVAKSSKSMPERLFAVDVPVRTKGILMSGQFRDRRNVGVSWMPDGRTLVYISKPVRK